MVVNMAEHSIVQDIINALKESNIVASRVYYYYPPNFNVLPLATVYEVTRTSIGIGDDSDVGVFYSVIAIDIYHNKYIESESLAEKIITYILQFFKRSSIVFKRVFVEDNQLIHITLQFKIPNRRWITWH